ncbi:MAG: SagB/ThcOx family dehydrogenase, partial [Syntrophobacteraceae bacterium]
MAERQTVRAPFGAALGNPEMVGRQTVRAPFGAALGNPEMVGRQTVRAMMKNACFPNRKLLVLYPEFRMETGKLEGVMNVAGKMIKLPAPAHDGKLSVEAAFLGRRSIRHYKEDALDLKEISQLLWAAQGIIRPGGYRTCPSAGALYPLELQLVAGKVDGLACGSYRYDCANHAILHENEKDIRHDLAAAALGQSMISRAPATIAVSAVFERTTRRYGERGIRYIFMEAGHA